MTSNNTNTWEVRGVRLYKCFIFADFSEAFGFMTRVALLAEQQNHHPKWTNTWNKVEVWLTTHDAGNVITDKDHALAASIDKLFR